MTNPDILVPLLLAFCGGLFARIVVRSFRLRYLISGAVYSIFACIIFVVIWSTYGDDPRLPSAIAVTLFGSIFGFATMLPMERHVPSVGVAIPVGVIALVMLVLQIMTSCFNFPVQIANDIVSPDGRCRAQLFYFTGWTPDSYFLICLKSNSPFERWKGAEEIAGGEIDGATEISWRDDHTLVFRYRSLTKLEPKIDHWRDVTIRYEPAATSN